MRHKDVLRLLTVLGLTLLLTVNSGYASALSLPLSREPHIAPCAHCMPAEATVADSTGARSEGDAEPVPKTRICTEGLWQVEVNEEDGVCTLLQYCGMPFEFLASVEIPETVQGYRMTRIAGYAFFGLMTDLLIFPDTLTTVDAYAFSMAYVSGECRISASVTSFSPLAFAYGTVNEVTVDAANPVYQAAQGALYTKDRSELICCLAPVDGTQYVVADSVRAIGEGAFFGKTQLSEVVLPAGLTKIGADAFAYTGISTLSIPAGVETIGTGALRNCASLKRIEVAPENTSFVMRDAMLFSADGTRLMRCPAASPVRSFTVPEGVERLDAGAFSCCKKLQRFVCGDALRQIGSSAFSGCVALQEIQLPSDAQIDTEQLFEECTSLAKVALPTSVTSLGNNAFYGCKKLKGVGIPDSVQSIGETAFYGCDSLQQIVIPDSVSEIGAGAFENCVRLQSVTLPASLREIADSLFQNTAIKDVQIPDGVTRIGANAFCGTPLKTAVLPANLISIGAEAFVASSITSLSLPDSVTMLGEMAFSNCSNLAEVTLSEGLAQIPSRCFEACGVLKEVRIPDGVKQIDAYAFVSCGQLSTAIIPDGVTHIGEFAFADCNRLTLLCSEGSAASEYAKSNGIKAAAFAPDA